MDVHVSFLLLIVWVAVDQWMQSHSAAAIAAGVGFIVALFGCIVLHELGHALMARRYGIHTRDILLLPIGGVARLERMPEQPVQELGVALAGPAVSIAIAALLLGGLALSGHLGPLPELGVTHGSFVQRLAMVNLFLVLFNSLPAFPMDGGRVLRALLAMRLGYVRATRVAAQIGQGLAIVLGIIGLLGNPVLVLIALFVWFGAAQESSLVQIRAALAGLPVGRAMLTDFRTLRADDALARAAELLLAGSQHDFPVVEDGRIIGLLTRPHLLAALAARAETTPVGEVMQREFASVDSTELLEGALAPIETGQCETVPVTHDGRLVGLLTTENLGEFLMVQSARRSGATASDARPDRASPAPAGNAAAWPPRSP